MNKQLIYIPVLLASLNIACSNNNTDVLGISETQAKTVKTKKRMSGHRLPEGVISVDIVNTNNRLHLLTGKHQQAQTTLWYQYSNDEGKSWSSAVKVLNDDNLPAKVVRGSDAQIAAQGDTIVVTWMRRVEGARFNAGPMQAARSIDSGQTWQYSAIPPDWITGPHGYMEMAADNLAMHVVWLDSRNGHSELKASQGLRYAKSLDGGLSWQANKTLDETTCSCCWNTLKTNANGNTFVLYRDKKPSDLAIGVIDDQQQWKYLNKVGAFNWDFDGCPHIGGGLDIQTTADNKRLHAIVGTGHEDHLGIHYLHSNDNGHNWSKPMQLGDESALHADIAAHDDGRVVAVWDMMGEDGLTVFVAESADQGINWSQPRQLSTTGMRASHPRTVKTENGFLTLWTESDGQRQTLGTQRF